MKKNYFADFETTQPGDDNSVEVYLWACVSGKKHWHGFDIKSFIDFLETKHGVFYFHNLKFDFSYIQYYLIENEIPYKLLEKKGSIYSVKMFDIELRDSLNFLPMTLKEVGENYCENFKKTSIDYQVFKGHKARPEEIDYCLNDCMVLQEGLNIYLTSVEDVLNSAGAYDSASKVRKKLTNAGIAFEAFKELSSFEQMCPKTTNAEYQKFRPAYRGGYVYSNPQGIVEDVQMIDCNSMYPFIYATIDMPYGKGYRCDEIEELKNKYKFFIVKVLISYDLKDGFIAIIGGGVGKFGSTIYKSSSNGEYEEQTFSNTDLALIEHFYDCDFKVVWGFGFNTKKEFFKDYADTFIHFKNSFKGVKRAVSKVLLNSPYGKTAMNGLNEIKEWKIDKEKQQVVSSVVGFEIQENCFQYLPIAIAICSSAREYLLKTAEKIGFENVYYMDTDSIKFKNVKTDIVFDPDRLGAWKDEGLCSLFKTISPKKYCYWGVKENGKVDETIHYTCAGFSKAILSAEMYHAKDVSKEFALELMNQFDRGLELSCLQSKLIKGGRALIPVKKMIK